MRRSWFHTTYPRGAGEGEERGIKRQGREKQGVLWLERQELTGTLPKSYPSPWQADVPTPQNS
jgi:hypothetical protein